MAVNCQTNTFHYFKMWLSSHIRLKFTPLEANLRIFSNVREKWNEFYANCTWLCCISTQMAWFISFKSHYWSLEWLFIILLQIFLHVPIVHISLLRIATTKQIDRLLIHLNSLQSLNLLRVRVYFTRKGTSLRIIMIKSVYDILQECEQKSKISLFNDQSILYALSRYLI